MSECASLFVVHVRVGGGEGLSVSVCVSECGCVGESACAPVWHACMHACVIVIVSVPTTMPQCPSTHLEWPPPALWDEVPLSALDSLPKLFARSISGLCGFSPYPDGLAQGTPHAFSRFHRKEGERKAPILPIPHLRRKHL